MRVTLKRLERKEAPCGHGFDVLADRHVYLPAGRIIRPAPAQGFLPAVGAEFQVKLASLERGLLLVCGAKIDSGAPDGMLDLHAIGARSRSVEGDFAFPVPDIGFRKAVFLLTHFILIFSVLSFLIVGETVTVSTPKTMI